MADFLKSLGFKAAGLEPTDDIKNNGFQAGYKPPAAYFNWFLTGVTQRLDELRDYCNKVIVYKSTSELGLDKASVTMDTLIGSMRDSSILFLYVSEEYAKLDVPTKYGNLVITRHNEARADATLIEMKTHRMWYGSVDSSKHAFSGWSNIYSTANKPTPADIGAVDKKGDTMSGKKLGMFNGIGSLETYDSAMNMRVRKNANDDSNSRRVSISSTANLDKALQFIDTVDGKDTIYEVYGEHNKPTPEEIGAAEKGHTHTPAEIGAMPDGVVPIAKGGTNATDVPTARTNLGFIQGSYNGDGTSNLRIFDIAGDRGDIGNALLIWSSNKTMKAIITPEGGTVWYDDGAWAAVTEDDDLGSRERICYFKGGKLYLEVKNVLIGTPYRDLLNDGGKTYYYQVL